MSLLRISDDAQKTQLNKPDPDQMMIFMIGVFNFSIIVQKIPEEYAILKKERSTPGKRVSGILNKITIHLNGAPRAKHVAPSFWATEPAEAEEGTHSSTAKACGPLRRRVKIIFPWSKKSH